jgi:hypothetical protein
MTEVDNELSGSTGLENGSVITRDAQIYFRPTFCEDCFPDDSPGGRDYDRISSEKEKLKYWIISPPLATRLNWRKLMAEWLSSKTLFPLDASSLHLSVH